MNDLKYDIHSLRTEINELWAEIYRLEKMIEQRVDKKMLEQKVDKKMLIELKNALYNSL